MKTQTVIVLIEGRVQGVGYRNWLQNEARRLGISGWCRNRKNGAVEALLYGAEHAITTLLQKCATGPVLARVDKLQTTAAEYDGSTLFLIKDTL